MTLLQFIADTDWDTPFFKQLAHNDTGAAAGHQAGMVFPKELRAFLPSLDEANTSADTPTTDRWISVEMHCGVIHVGDGRVRYQFQTWGGTRSAESRITEGFQPLRNLAAKDDVLLFQRRADLYDQFRLILVKRGTAEFKEIEGMLGGRRWGPLMISNPPVTQVQLTEARKEIDEVILKPFQAIRESVRRIDTRQLRIARSSVFRDRVKREYRRQCAVSRVGIATPTFLYEVESAHVVPISEGGSEDVRNGIALTQTLHWAFDRGLFGVLPNRTIYVPNTVRRMPENAYLCQFEKQAITEAETIGHRVHPDAFAWHFANRVKPWD